jgi:hypothetical protein
VIGSGKFSGKKKESRVKQEYQSKSEAAEQFRAAKEASADAIQLALPTAEML